MLLLLLCVQFPVLAQDSVMLEELTWVEVRDAIASGKTTAIIPTGGTEQNGPHMVLGKHNYVVRYNASEIARRLGNALVAPILEYVPEGNIEPADGHMLYPGSITLPQEYFEKVVEYAARSLALHGFTHIVLLGDSGGNQQGLANVATLLNQEWSDSYPRVLHANYYYGGNPNVSPEDRRQLLADLGLSPEQFRGTHANIGDTAQLMFVYPEGIRMELRKPGTWEDGNGVDGDPTAATAELGEIMVNGRIDGAVQQIKEFTQR